MTREHTFKILDTEEGFNILTRKYNGLLHEYEAFRLLVGLGMALPDALFISLGVLTEDEKQIESCVENLRKHFHEISNHVPWIDGPKD